MKMRQRFRWIAVGLIAMLTLGVFPFSGELAAGEKITFMTGWILYGRDMAWFTAMDKGYFRQEGVNVSIIRGYGGGGTAKSLVGKGVEIAGLDPGNLLRLRAKGSAFKAVSTWYDLAPYAILTLDGSPIKSLKDLEGRSLGTPSYDSTWSVFPAVAKMNNFDLKKIKQVEVAPAVRDAGLLAGNYDASTNFVTSFPLVFKAAAKQGKKVRFFILAKHGLDIYGNSIVTSEKFIRERTAELRGFLKAALRGAAYAIEHPDEAADILLKYVPAGDREANRQTWDLTVDLWLTSDAKRMGLGHMVKEKWARTRDILTGTLKIPVVVPTEDLYTNEFLPKVFPKRGPRVFPAVF
ncbi:MAG: ABC transporter substrate-binding protein [Nitrospinota bacterium]